MLGWPKRCKSAHAFLWEYSRKRLQLAYFLGQLGVFLTLRNEAAPGGRLQRLEGRAMPTGGQLPPAHPLLVVEGVVLRELGRGRGERPSASHTAPPHSPPYDKRA
jgi:hypothetical protein